MIFRIAFDIVGFAMLVGNFYYGLRLFSLAVGIKRKNGYLIGKGWNGRVTPRQLRKLREVTRDEDSKASIDLFLKYHQVVTMIFVLAIFLFLLIGFLNRLMTGG
jgi:hypothetical protein